MADDDETTDPHIAVFRASDLTLAVASHFRCGVCLHDVLLTEPTGTAPVCGNCDRYMAPVNSGERRARGQA